MSHEFYGSGPEPYPYGDGVHIGHDLNPHIVEDVLRQAAIDDAIWRDKEARARMAASSQTFTPEQTITPPATTTSSETPESDTFSRVPSIVTARPATKAPDVLVTENAYDRPLPEYVPAPDQTGGRTLKVAGFMLAGLAVFGGYSYLQSDHETKPNQAVAPAESGPQACAVSGIDEKNSIGTIEFQASVGDAVVQVIALDASGTPKLLNNAEQLPGQPTSYTYNTTGLHDQELIVRVGTTDCDGAFTLGTEKPGDETFLAS